MSQASGFLIVYQETMANLEIPVISNLRRVDNVTSTGYHPRHRLCDDRVSRDFIAYFIIGYLRFSSILKSWFGMYAEIMDIWKIMKNNNLIFIFYYYLLFVSILFVVNDVFWYFRFIYPVRLKLILKWSALVWCWHNLWSTLKANNCFFGRCFHELRWKVVW